jgi:hypothetical protein
MPTQTDKTNLVKKVIFFDWFFLNFSFCACWLDVNIQKFCMERYTNKKAIPYIIFNSTSITAFYSFFESVLSQSDHNILPKYSCFHFAPA